MDPLPESQEQMEKKLRKEYQEKLQKKLREEYEIEKAERFKDINTLDLRIRTQVTTKNVNDQDKYGTTVLERAARLGMIQGVQKLLKLGADPLIQDTWGYSPLYMAAQCGNLEIVKLLVWNIKKNSDIDLNKILSKRRETLIYSACQGIRQGYDGCWEIIHWLIVEHSMDPWAPDVDGRLPKVILQENEPGYDHLLIKCYNEKYSSKYIKQEKDSKNNEQEFKNRILSVNPGNVNEILNGFSILQLAMDHGSDDEIKYLLELKADPLIHPSKGTISDSPLFRACHMGKIESMSQMIKFMEKEKDQVFDPNTCLTSNKDSLIHLAILGINQGKDGCQRVIEWLIREKDMNPFLENDFHLTPRDLITDDLNVDLYDDLLEKLGCYL